MAYTDIDKPSDYFNTALYTGNYSTNNITSLDFQPDLVWIKKRSAAESHVLTDVVRGTGGNLYSNSTSAEDTGITTGVTSFNSDGFSLGANNGFNQSGATFASWNWKAGTSFTNDASATGIGSMDSAGSVNEEAGFAIVSYTGTGSAGTIKHGLSTAPSMIILKNRSAAEHWMVGTTALGWTKNLVLSLANAVATDGSVWNNTAPTSSVFSVGNSGAVNTSSQNYIAYCFAEKKGYSKFLSYTGNSNADGTFVYTGFKPAFVMVKMINGADDWQILDNKRNTFNVMNEYLRPNSNGATTTNDVVDFTSSGFKQRSSFGSWNHSSYSYLYMAFAENPFVTSTGVPATAR